MSIAHLLNGTCTVYRLTETVDEYGDAVNTYTATSSFAVRLTPAGGSLGSTAAGQRPAGQRVAFIDGHADVEITDILAVTVGPYTGTRWRVVSVARPSPPGWDVAHHTEATVDPWTGKLPEAPAEPDGGDGEMEAAGTFDSEGETVDSGELTMDSEVLV
jgi:hypothetical protein